MGWLGDALGAVGDAVTKVTDGAVWVGEQAIDTLAVKPVTKGVEAAKGLGALVWERGVVDTVTDGLAAPFQLADAAAEKLVPGYSTAKHAAETTNSAVNRYVPGGWKGVGAGAVVLLILMLWRPAVRTTGNVGKGLAATYAPGAAALAHGKPLPRKVRHVSKGTWRHTGRPGRADIVTSSAKRLEVCADNERHGLTAARSRYQGHRLHPVSTAGCDINPDKVHVRIARRSS